MPRKSAENGTPTTRRKKATKSVQPVTSPPIFDRNTVVPINLEDEIRRRAYEIYLERGSTPGDEQEDWISAEREIRARYEQRDQQTA